MKRAVKLMVLAVAVAGSVACEKTIIPNKIWDEPKINFLEEVITVAAEGGELTVALNSTGVDNANVVAYGKDSWETDEEGNKTPKEDWVEIVKIIDEYDPETRALAQWQSGIVVRVKPNDTGAQRSATLYARSFTVKDHVTITQRAE